MKISFPQCLLALTLGALGSCQSQRAAYDPTPFYASGGNGSWHAPKSVIDAWVSVAWDGEVFVVDGRGDLYASRDQGQTWSALTAAAPDHLALTFIVPGSSTQRYVCVEASTPDGAYPYCTADGGASWNAVGTPVRDDGATPQDHVEIAVGPTAPGHLLASVRSPLACHDDQVPHPSLRLAWSGDLGKSWTFGAGLDARNGYLSTFAGGVELRTRGADFGEDVSVCGSDLVCATFDRRQDSRMVAVALNPHRPDVALFLHRFVRPDQTADLLVTADGGRHYAVVPDPLPCREHCLFVDGDGQWGAVVQAAGGGQHLEFARDITQGFTVQGPLPEAQCQLFAAGVAQIYCRGRKTLYLSRDVGVQWTAVALPGAPQT